MSADRPRRPRDGIAPFRTIADGRACVAPAAVTTPLQVADLAWDRARGAGAAVARPPGDQVWADRCGPLTDLLGHRRSIGGPVPRPTA